MSEARLASLKKDFKTLDSDGDGKLSTTEIVNFMILSDPSFMDDINDTGGRASAEKRLRGTRAYAGSGPLI